MIASISLIAGQVAPSIYLSLSPVLGLQLCDHTWPFIWGYANSVPLICISILYTKPSPQPMSFNFTFLLLQTLKMYGIMFRIFFGSFRTMIKRLVYFLKHPHHQWCVFDMFSKSG